VIHLGVKENVEFQGYGTKAKASFYSVLSVMLTTHQVVPKRHKLKKNCKSGPHLQYKQTDSPIEFLNRLLDQNSYDRSSKFISRRIDMRGKVAFPSYCLLDIRYVMCNVFVHKLVGAVSIRHGLMI
jgi:hypothetical protein